MWCLLDDVYVYGGKTQKGTRTASMWKFEGETARWIWQPDGPHPGRSGAASWTLRDEFYLYGGRTDDGTVLSDFFVFHPTTRGWVSLGNGTGPAERYGMAYWSDPLSSRIFLYGGRDKFGTVKNDMWSYSIESKSWSRHNMDTSPGPVDDGIATRVEDKAYLFGGKTSASGESQYHKDVWRLDLSTIEWVKLDPADAQKEAHRGREDHVLFPSPTKNSLHLFGGKHGTTVFGDFWEFDLDELEWKQIKGAHPSQRWSPAYCIDSESATVIQGGVLEDPNKMHNDVWRYGGTTPHWFVEFFKTFNLDAVTLSSTIGGVCSMLLLIFAVVASVIWCIVKLRNRRTNRMQLPTMGSSTFKVGEEDADF